MDVKNDLCQWLSDENSQLWLDMDELKNKKRKNDIKNANKQLLQEMADKMNFVSTDQLKAAKKEISTLKSKVQSLD